MMNRIREGERRRKDLKSEHSQKQRPVSISVTNVNKNKSNSWSAEGGKDALISNHRVFAAWVESSTARSVSGSLVVFSIVGVGVLKDVISDPKKWEGREKGQALTNGVWTKITPRKPTNLGAKQQATIRTQKIRKCQTGSKSGRGREDEDCVNTFITLAHRQVQKEAGENLVY
jgi:hypothetical protein